MDSVELLKAYFKKNKLEFSGDVKEEINHQNQQSLAPFLYYVYGKPFYNVYLGSVLIQEKFFQLQKEITKLFNENHIPHYYFKGSVLANIYPDTALRTRGDIDLIVKEEDYLKAKKLLSQNAFVFESECSHHCGFLKNNLEIELHHKFFDKENQYGNYFKDSFAMAYLKSNYEYEMNPNYHFIFLIFHLNKHLLTGEGLRSLLDFYYMDKAYSLDY